MKAVKKEWLSYLYDIPNKLTNSNYIDKHINDRIKDIAADYICYKNKNYATRFYFFHLGYIPKVEIIDSYKNFYYFSFNDIKEKFLEFESKQSLTEPEFITINLTYDKNPDIIEKRIDKHQTLISLITGDEIIRLREEFKFKLFDTNLRFSLGSNKINKKIAKSAQYDKKKFYFYNNGITITSKGFKFKNNNNTLRIDYPQIINGAQTVNAIYCAYNDRLNKLKRDTGEEKKSKIEALKEFNELKILFRIIRTIDDDGIFARNVIESNNTQNAIQKRDFYANAPEQIQLQKIFADFGYFYEIKRGDREYIKKEFHNLLKKKLNDFKFKNERRDIEVLASLWMAYKGQDPSQKNVGKERILVLINIMIKFFLIEKKILQKN